MGWIVLPIWLATLALASQVSAATATEYGLGLSRVAFMFLTAAAMSGVLLLLM